MKGQTDPDFLKNEAYKDSSGLEVRNRIQERYRTNPLSWFDWLFAHMPLPERGNLLELGCGSGELWEKHPELSPGCLVVLSDFSLAMARTAQNRLGRRFSYAVLDMQSIPFKEGVFDVVLGIGLLDHVPNRRRALDEVRRVLKRGGRFYVTAGGHAHLREIKDLVRPFFPQASYGGDPERFGIENGAKLLSPWFSEINCSIYRDEMVFTRAGPIQDYVLSEAWVRHALQGVKRAAFSWYLKKKLAESGEIRVTAEKGLFVAG